VASWGVDGLSVVLSDFFFFFLFHFFIFHSNEQNTKVNYKICNLKRKEKQEKKRKTGKKKNG
jgi:hypothetical protein